MTDNIVSTVGKVELDRSNRAKPADDVRAKEKDGGSSPAARYAASTVPASKGFSDVLLRFKVDPGTKEVTVMVVDKASRKVVRTIPPEELKTLNEGELFELFT
jgi:uncharacterized FlaG/YvyC family protein